MKQEIVLPKFKIPGQTNWLVRGLWIGGALVVVLTGVVVFGLARQRQAESDLAAKVAAERVQAEAAAAAAAAKPAPKAVRVAGGKTLATKAPAPLSASLETGKGGAVAKPRAGLAGKAKFKKARGRAGYTLRKKPGRASKLYATKNATKKNAATKAGAAKPAAKAKPGAKGGDAIDDILRGFK